MQIHTIQDLIYEIRGQKVMLDFDLASLYGTDTRTLKQAVRRNRKRFPKDFMFQLSIKEWKEVITNCDNLTDRVKFSPVASYAFTEHGVIMAASILRTKRAHNMSIMVVRAFVSLKQFALNYKDLSNEIKELKRTAGGHAIKLNVLFAALKKLLAKKVTQKTWEDRALIGFKTGNSN